jgi:hypothetical protein
MIVLTNYRTSRRLCRCKAPHRQHWGFVWEVPDGRTHRVTFFVSQEEIG